MNLKQSLLILISLMLFGNISAQHKNETLTDLINEAIRVSPKIKMLEYKLKVAESRIEQNTNLPDPMLTLGLMNMPTNTFSFTQEPMTGKVIGLSQAIPFPGGLSAKAKVKAVDTLIVNEELKDYKNEISKTVSTLYYNLIFVREEIKLTNESKNLLSSILEVVKSKYEVSKASMQNIIKVNVQQTRIQDKIEILKGKENSIVAELNAFLLRDIETSIFVEDVLATEFNLVSNKELIEIAKENRPILKGIKLSNRKSKLMEEQAEYEFYPNFNFGVQYSQRDYNNFTGIDFSDFLSVVVGIILPINYGGKKTAKINEAKFLQNFYQEKFNESVQELNSSIGKTISKLSELQNREILFSKTLVVQTEQSFRIALSDYQVGKIDFVNVIDAEREILNVKTELLKIQTDYKVNIAELEFLVGRKLN
ncbi:MAG: TolC family protein [Melioribacteraceae bacterium]